MHVSHGHPSVSTLRHSWMLRVWVCKRRVNSRRLSSLPCLWFVLTPPAWVPAGINAQVVNHKLLLWWLRHKLPPLTTDNGLQCRGGSMSSFRSLVRSQIDLTFLISLLIDSMLIGCFRYLLPERDYVTFGSLLSQIRLSVVCRLSETFVRRTQGVEAFGNIPSPLCTLAWPLCKILRRSSQGSPSVGGVKHKRSSKIERCKRYKIRPRIQLMTNRKWHIGNFHWCDV